MAENILSGIRHMCNVQHEAKSDPYCLVYLGLHLHKSEAAESACHAEKELFHVPTVQTSDGFICCLSFL